MVRLDVDALTELGLFRFAPDRKRAIELAHEQGYAFAGETRRLYHADAEALAEHGVRDFLGKLAPALRKLGVPIEVRYGRVRVPAKNGKPAGFDVASLDADGWLSPGGPMPAVEALAVGLTPGAALVDVTEDDDGDSGIYSMFFGEREFVVYAFDTDEEWDGWRAATQATLSILNELLVAHGVTERAYALHDDNDLHIALVTPAMADVVNRAAAPRARLVPADRG